MIERVDIRREDGTPTGETKERELVHRDGDLHGTAHVWLFRRTPERESAEILLQKRTQNKDSFPGYYDISSAGHVPAGSDFLESALRELEEELGIQAAPEELRPILTLRANKEAVFYGQLFRNHEFAQVYLYECGLEPEEMKLQEEEVESVLWMDFRECLDHIRKDDILHCILIEEFEELARQMELLLAQSAVF